MLKYFFYKIYNNLNVSLMSKKSYPLLRFYGGSHAQSNSFYFDLTDKTTHLGDRLFFCPLIKMLIENNCSVKIPLSDKLSFTLLSTIFKCSPIFQECPSEEDIIVIPKPSYLNLKNKYKKMVLIDFLDTTCRMKIANQLLCSFKQKFQLEYKYSPPPFLGTIKPQKIKLDKDQKYYFFNNYLLSGKFRKYFVNQNKLSKKCIELKELGYKIIHIGSMSDKKNDHCVYPFVDQDLRGKLLIEDLSNLVRCEQIHGIVTYDNFLMHLIGVFDKKAYVLFRGRFLSKARRHHFKYVNNTFFEDESKLIYL